MVNQRGGEVEVEVNHDGVAFGTALRLAVAVHPRVRPLEGPAGARPYRSGDAYAAIWTSSPGWSSSPLDQLTGPEREVPVA